MSGLDLRQRESILKGGKRGPAIVPGKPADSLLYKAVMREGDLQMPPGKKARGGEDIPNHTLIERGPLGKRQGLPNSRGGSLSPGKEAASAENINKK